MANNGKDLEAIVQLIEKSISPYATVEHDVQMPILNSRIGATTQCDILIRTGARGRETITIVEVQDRNSQTKPNEFRGWKQKLSEVGAQHLIYVSRQDFPASIKEQARLSGDSVLLMTIRESIPENLPFDFINFKYQFIDFELTSLDLVEPTVSRSEAIELNIREELLSKGSVSQNDLIWSLDRQHLTSLFLLCRDYYTPPIGSESGSGTINFDLKNGLPLYFSINNKFIRIGLNCKFKWSRKIIEKPVSVLSYEQTDYGTQAWMVEIEHDSPKGKLLIRVPLVKRGSVYEINSLYSELPKDVELILFKN